MRNTRAQQFNVAAPYTAGFRLSSAVLEASSIPERYRWSDDRIRTDLIEQDQRRARAVWLKTIAGRGWGHFKAALSLPARSRVLQEKCQGATKTSVSG